MLFTVIRYLPILEEETPGHRVELSKKADHNDSADDDDTNDDDPDDEKTDLFFNLGHFSITGLQTEHNFHIKHQAYRFPVANITTPPPRV